MESKLHGKRIAMLVTDGFEQVEPLIRDGRPIPISRQPVTEPAARFATAWLDALSRVVYSSRDDSLRGYSGDQPDPHRLSGRALGTLQFSTRERTSCRSRYPKALGRCVGRS